VTGFIVVTLNWNGREVLPAMIRSLSQQLPELGGRLLVFDNASTDGSDDLVEEEFGDKTWFSIVRSDVNLGFAAGANEAIAGLTEEVIVLANSDTVFRPGSLLALLQGMERHPEAGLVGPRLLWPDGTLQQSQRDFPFPGPLMAEHIPFLGRYTAKSSSHDTERRVDWMVGAVMTLRRRAFEEVGGFDESYFFYHEETDLQYRLYEKGWESWFIPSSLVVHVEGAAARQKFGRETYLRYIPEKIRFISKHGTPGAATIFRIYMLALQMTRALLGLVIPVKRRSDIRFTLPYCLKAMRLLYGAMGTSESGESMNSRSTVTR